MRWGWVGLDAGSSGWFSPRGNKDESSTEQINTPPPKRPINLDTRACFSLSRTTMERRWKSGREVTGLCRFPAGGVRYLK